MYLMIDHLDTFFVYTFTKQWLWKQVLVHLQCFKVDFKWFFLYESLFSSHYG